jgi:flavodoxin
MSTDTYKFKFLGGVDNMNIVIYGSQYGTAKRYAEELSNRLGFELKSYEEVADVNLYDTIIYVGALYAGGVLGRKRHLKA